MEAVTIVGLSSAAINVLTALAVLVKWARWSGIVDTRLDDIAEHIKSLPCRRCTKQE